MRPFATICAVVFFATGLFAPTFAQNTAPSAAIVVDDDGTATVGDPVDCDGTSSSNVYTSLTAAVNAAEGDANRSTIYVCPSDTPYGPDENLLITTSLEIQGAGAAEVVIESRAQSDQGDAVRIETPESATGDLVVGIRGLTIVHTSNGANVNAKTIRIGSEVDAVEIRDVTIDRQGSLASTASAIEPNGFNVTVEDCDITGGPIGFFGRPEGTYTLRGNVVRGAGDEGIWIVDGDVITVTDNTVFGSPGDGESRDDQIGVAIYRAETSLTLSGNDASAITRNPLLLGAGIPVVDPSSGTAVPLESVSQMRDLVLANNSLGPVVFLSTSDGETLREETGNASADRETVTLLRRTITTEPGTGGSGAYNASAIDAAAAGDVLHLTDGALYAESVTNALPSGGGKNLGIATTASGTASIQALTIADNTTLSVPSGTLAITQSFTLGSGTELTGTAVDLAPGATLSDGGLVAGRLTATRTVGAGASDPFGTIGASLTANGTQGPGTVTVTRIDGDPVTKGDGSISRIYDIEASQLQGLDVDVDLEYDDGDLGGDDELATASVSDDGLLGVFRSTDDGETWSELPGVQADTDANTFTATGLSELSRFTLAAAGGVLPVDLVSLTAQTEGADALLSWTTATETQNAGFRVQQQRSEAFETIGFVEGAQTTSTAQTYRFRVRDLAIGRHVFRLVQVDTDGAATPSREVAVTVRPEGAVEIAPITPNPMSQRGTLSIAVAERQHVTARIFDALGRRVATLHDGEMSAGQAHSLSIDPAALSSGAYFLRVVGEGFQETRKFVVVR